MCEALIHNDITPMKALGIYGSPRQGGNSDMLLDQALRGARAANADTQAVYARNLDMSGCRECLACSATGRCVIQDPMQIVYPLLLQSRVIFMATPIFFYGPTSQLKRLIDRCQALWSRRMLEKSFQDRNKYHGGKGYLIAVGATRGASLFTGLELTAKYFFDALDKSYEGGLFFREVDEKGAVARTPQALEQAFRFGFDACEG